MSVVYTHTNDGVAQWDTPSLQEGDIIVAVIGMDARYHDTDDVVPEGFTPVGEPITIRIETSGDAVRTVTGASWRRVTQPGPVTVGLPAQKHWLTAAVLRGPTAMAAHAQEVRNAQPFTYPGLELVENMTGDVLHIGMHKGAGSGSPSYQVPAGDTTIGTQSVEGTSYRPPSNWDPTGWGHYVNPGGSWTGKSYISVGHEPLEGAASVPATAGGDRLYGSALTVLFATVSGPSAPTITRPQSGTFDLAGGFTLEWVPSFEPQTGYAVRRKLDAEPFQSWDGSAWVEGTDEIVLDGDVTSLHVSGAGINNDGATWQYEVATVGGVFKPTLGAFANVTLTATSPPPAPGLTVSDTTSGELTSFMPTITVTGGVSAGSTLTGYRITLAQGDYTHTETITTSTAGASWDVPIEVGSQLVNDGEPVTVSAWTVQNESQVSEPTVLEYALAVPRPPVPGLTIRPVNHPVSGAPGNRVTVTPTAPITGTFEVARVVNGQPVTIWAGPIGDGWDVTDYLPPSVGAVHYQARVTTDEIAPVTSHWGDSVLTTLPDTCGWIIDPLHPETAVRTNVMTIGDHVSDLRTQAMAPLGQRGWVVHAGTPLDQTGALTVEVEGDEQLAALRSLLTSGARLFVRGWSETGTRDRDARGTALDIWVRLVGEVNVTRPLAGPWATRDVTVSYVTVDPPAWT